ncbi:putative polyamine oxidase 5, partial [Cardiosporidium cionae]
MHCCNAPGGHDPRLRREASRSVIGLAMKLRPLVAEVCGGAGWESTLFSSWYNDELRKPIDDKTVIRVNQIWDRIRAHAALKMMDHPFITRSHMPPPPSTAPPLSTSPPVAPSRETSQAMEPLETPSAPSPFTAPLIPSHDDSRKDLPASHPPQTMENSLSLFYPLKNKQEGLSVENENIISFVKNEQRATCAAVRTFPKLPASFKAMKEDPLPSTPFSSSPLPSFSFSLSSTVSLSSSNISSISAPPILSSSPLPTTSSTYPSSSSIPVFSSSSASSLYSLPHVPPFVSEKVTSLQPSKNDKFSPIKTKRSRNRSSKTCDSSNLSKDNFHKNPNISIKKRILLRKAIPSIRRRGRKPKGLLPLSLSSFPTSTFSHFLYYGRSLLMDRHRLVVETTKNSRRTSIGRRGRRGGVTPRRISPSSTFEEKSMASCRRNIPSKIPHSPSLAPLSSCFGPSSRVRLALCTPFSPSHTLCPPEPVEEAAFPHPLSHNPSMTGDSLEAKKGGEESLEAKKGGEESLEAKKGGEESLEAKKGGEESLEAKKGGEESLEATSKSVEFDKIVQQTSTATPKLPVATITKSPPRSYEAEGGGEIRKQRLRYHAPKHVEKASLFHKETGKRRSLWSLIEESREELFSYLGLQLSDLTEEEWKLLMVIFQSRFGYVSCLEDTGITMSRLPLSDCRQELYRHYGV